MVSVWRSIGRLLGFKAAIAGPSESEERWQVALERYRWADAQVREASSPEELELAHQAWLTAQADLQWLVRLAKRDHGLALRPVSETHRIYQALIHHLRKAEEAGALAAEAEAGPGARGKGQGKGRRRARVRAKER